MKSFRLAKILHYVYTIVMVMALLSLLPNNLEAQDFEVCIELEVLPIEQLWLSTLPGNAVILDVRKNGEVQNGKLPGAKVNDVEGGSFKKDLRKMSLSADQPIYVYCRTGRRSGQAVDSLLDMGFERVVWLKGGFDAWSKANREIEK